MKLIVKKIKSINAFNKYLDIVESFHVINPFYAIMGADLKELIDEKMRYFLFKNDTGEILVLMPFLLRKVPRLNLENTYYDVISPYGYSGPLFNQDLSRGYLIKFWELVDNWYKENNVVSEFMRFSLNNNHQFYSGVLIPALSNVRGEIIEENKQWDHFKPKVRNNYRKSLEHHLKVKFLNKELTNDDIQLYYDIYIKTMSRIGAEKQYFHSFEYFENIIKLSNDNFIIALVFKEHIAISTELILISGNTLYSYLGGTLSEYFDSRPNDFLKIEVMKWARKNQYKYYILGGGRSDHDSLYQYKKAFFPNDPDIIYYTGRKIINKKVYDTLDKIMTLGSGMDVQKLKEAGHTAAYFPTYRRKTPII